MKTTQVDGGKRDKKRERREAEADQFVLVDSDDEGYEEGERGDGEGEGGDGQQKGEGGDGGDGEGQNAGREREDDKGDVAGERAPSPEIVEIKHVPQRGETLLTIARKYATDVSPPTLL